MDTDPEPTEYALEPPDETTPGGVGSGAVDRIEDELHCVGCGYDLRSLDADGRCPECGIDIRRSASGNLLVLSSGEYLAKLHRGVTLILIAIALQLCLVVGAIIVVVTGLWAGTSTLALDLVSVAIEGLGLWGWWLFSEPDPAAVGTDTGQRPRIVVRVALIIGAATLIFNTIIPNLPNPPSDIVFMAFVVTVEIVNVAAQVAKFFAAMLYIRWLAPRLPDTRVHDRARRLMWLGPLLMTVGVLILIGPLIALALYWSMLNWVRRDLRGIREENARRYGVGAVTLET